MPKFQEHVPLSGFTSYKIGGEARYFFEAKSEEDVRAAVLEAHERSLPLFVLGGGTNLLISDNGFSGLVLRPNVVGLEANDTEVRVGAGVRMADLLRFAAEQSLSGLEWAGGLPGTVGGAIRGNAGAFGGETKDIVKSIASVDSRSGETRIRPASKCGFSYRSSIFKEQHPPEIVVWAVLALVNGDAEAIRSLAEEKMRYRRERHPLEYPNVGSIFKNVDWSLVPEAHRGALQNVLKTDPVPVVPAAYLISEAGLKEARVGGAMVSSKHPNFIVNVGHATASDVSALIEHVQREVRNKFQIELVEEVTRV